MLLCTLVCVYSEGSATELTGLSPQDVPQDIPSHLPIFDLLYIAIHNETRSEYFAALDYIQY